MWIKFVQSILIQIYIWYSRHIKQPKKNKINKGKIRLMLISCVVLHIFQLTRRHVSDAVINYENEQHILCQR